MDSALFVDAVSLLGGLTLLLMAIHLFKSRWNMDFEGQDKGYGTVFGGIIFTALNPGFPRWWVTAGARMLLEGYKIFGLLGVGVIVVGHWIADIGYFTLVSTLVHHGKQNLLNDKNINKIKNFLALVLFIIGVYFLFREVHIQGF